MVKNYVWKNAIICVKVESWEVLFPIIIIGLFRASTQDNAQSLE